MLGKDLCTRGGTGLVNAKSRRFSDFKHREIYSCVLILHITYMHKIHSIISHSYQKIINKEDISQPVDSTEY